MAAQVGDQRDHAGVDAGHWPIGFLGPRRKLRSDVHRDGAQAIQATPPIQPSRVTSY